MILEVMILNSFIAKYIYIDLFKYSFQNRHCFLFNYIMKTKAVLHFKSISFLYICSFTCAGTEKPGVKQKEKTAVLQVVPNFSNLTSESGFFTAAVFFLSGLADFTRCQHKIGMVLSDKDVLFSIRSSASR